MDSIAQLSDAKISFHLKSEPDFALKIRPYLEQVDLLTLISRDQKTLVYRKVKRMSKNPLKVFIQLMEIEDDLIFLNCLKSFNCDFYYEIPYLRCDANEEKIVSNFYANHEILDELFVKEFGNKIDLTYYHFFLKLVRTLRKLRSSEVFDLETNYFVNDKGLKNSKQIKAMYTLSIISSFLNRALERNIYKIKSMKTIYVPNFFNTNLGYFLDLTFYDPYDLNYHLDSEVLCNAELYKQMNKTIEIAKAEHQPYLYFLFFITLFEDIKCRPFTTMKVEGKSYNSWKKVIKESKGLKEIDNSYIAEIMIETLNGKYRLSGEKLISLTDSNSPRKNLFCHPIEFSLDEDNLISPRFTQTSKQWKNGEDLRKIVSRIVRTKIGKK